MTGRRLSKKHGGKALRSASEPVTIYLDTEPYILTESSLKGQVEIGRSRFGEWSYPMLRILSFNEGTLTIKNTSKKKF